MSTRVTIQDIADSLGLSRNTVSKAINNTGTLAPATRRAILKKAQELGYKFFLYAQGDFTLSSSLAVSERKAPSGEFVLFTAGILDSLHFSAKMLDVMQEEAAKMECGFTIFRVTQRELAEKKLPANFDTSRTRGIFCVEMFDLDYCRLLCETGLPLLLIDTPVVFGSPTLKADILLMDNRSGVYEFVKKMADKGKKKIGFVGEELHCRSFFERYDAYRGALTLFDLEYRAEWVLTGNKIIDENARRTDYRAYLTECIKAWKECPEVILCANDFIATDLLVTFRELGIKVPDDVLLCGFDDSPQALILSPALTSIRINAHDIGLFAMTMMTSRIENPSLAYRTAYVESTLVCRASTGD